MYVYIYIYIYITSLSSCNLRLFRLGVLAEDLKFHENRLCCLKSLHVYARWNSCRETPPSPSLSKTWVFIEGVNYINK